MADTFVGPKIEHEPGGDALTVKSGGSITYNSGSTISNTASETILGTVAFGTGSTQSFGTGSTFTMSTGSTFTNAFVTRKSLVVTVPSATAGATAQILDRVWAPQQAVTILAVSLLPAGACAGHATDYFTLALRNIGTGATDTINSASLALTTGNALTANIPKAFSVSATGGQTITANSALVYFISPNGSGIDFPPGELNIDYAVTQS